MEAYLFVICIVIFTGSYSSPTTDDSPELTLKVLIHQTTLLLDHVTKLKKVAAEQRNSSKIYDGTCSTLSERLTPPMQVIQIFKNCNEIYEAGHFASGVYSIHLFHGQTSINVFCDMETVGSFSNKRGWIIIQQRMNGRVNFDRGWNDYVDGFGFPDDEQWLGLRNILRITNQKKIGKYDTSNTILRIELEDWDGVKAFLEYSSFALTSEQYDFQIRNLGPHNATPGIGNYMAFSMHIRFSTSDHNNDAWRRANCVKSQRGGWWFGYCGHINLNGVYSHKREKISNQKIFVRNWRILNPNNTAFRYVSMKLQ
uniref:fibroleukin-like n=1 Tax=Styela clava TaxID=7725 RepID=UPI0019397C0D|nr:fibroleukin-like [Styela clava]